MSVERTSMIAHIYTSVFQAVSGRGYAGRLERKQIRQEEQEEREEVRQEEREDRKRERQKARGQEESSP
jgi:hypothetical protein